MVCGIFITKHKLNTGSRFGNKDNHCICKPQRMLRSTFYKKNLANAKGNAR